jgi:hypothetical protein
MCLYGTRQGKQWIPKITHKNYLFPAAQVPSPTITVTVLWRTYDSLTDSVYDETVDTTSNIRSVAMFVTVSLCTVVTYNMCAHESSNFVPNITCPVAVTNRRCSVVGLVTMIQAGRSRVRVPMRWNFSSFQPHYGPGVDSASNRNQYQEPSWGVKGGRGVKPDNLTAICEPIV